MKRKQIGFLYQRERTKNKELEECVRRANIFFEDVMPQLGKLCLQDYENMNLLGLLLTKLRKEKK